jgi:prepilin-type N-terminal cleavage/methylation domain-containing protein
MGTLRHNLRSRRGLTLVELLVALAISSVVLASIFYFMTTSSRTFRVLNDTTQSTDRVNFAMETVLQDLRRAGYLAVPNTNITVWPNYTRVCGNPDFAPNGLRAMTLFDGGATYQPPRGSDQVLVGRQPDRLRLVGAYRADRRYRAYFASPGQSFLRAYNDGEAVDMLNYRFDGAFVAVYSPLGGAQFVRARRSGGGGNAVTADVSFDKFRLDFASGDTIQELPGLDDDFCRFSGVANSGLDIVPLHAIQYDIVRDPNLPTSTVLTREELASDGTVIQRVIVARDVVDFQVWFDRTNSVVGAVPDIEIDSTATAAGMADDRGTFDPALAADAATSSPEQARYAYVQISARLNTAMPGLQPEGSGVVLRDVYELTAVDGANVVPRNEFTRVLTIRGEAEMQNFSLADL